MGWAGTIRSYFMLVGTLVFSSSPNDSRCSESEVVVPLRNKTRWRRSGTGRDVVPTSLLCLSNIFFHHVDAFTY